MSRTSIVLVVVILAGLVGGAAWKLLRSRPGELDIAAKEPPALPSIKVAAGDWPWWRGPNANNHAADTDIVTTWSETENIVWKAPVSGRGHSSPILVGNRVIVTSADETAQRQFLVCLDRTTGEKLWDKTIHEQNFPRMHADNSHASSTPASDGERVFVAFDNGKAIYVTALDLEGKILWSVEAGPHGGGGSHGYGSSLALWGPYVYVSDDSPSKGWIAALNRQTGETSWRKGRRTGIGSYGSPIIVDVDGKTMFLLVGNGNVSAYDPNKGDLLWERGGLGEVSGNTVTTSPTMIFASSGYPKRNFLALKSDGSIAWKKEGSNEFPYPPSMLWHDGYLYIVSDQGTIVCYRAENGEQKWKERLPGSYYSSPLLVGKNIYACNREGLTTIFEASPDGYSEVRRNKLGAGINASPIAVGGKLYIRTDTHLYCIGKK